MLISDAEFWFRQFILINYEGKAYVGQTADVYMEGLLVNCIKQLGDKNSFVAYHKLSIPSLCYFLQMYNESRLIIYLWIHSATMFVHSSYDFKKKLFVLRILIHNADQF